MEGGQGALPGESSGSRSPLPIGEGQRLRACPALPQGAAHRHARRLGDPATRTHRTEVKRCVKPSKRDQERPQDRAQGPTGHSERAAGTNKGPPANGSDGRYTPRARYRRRSCLPKLKWKAEGEGNSRKRGQGQTPGARELAAGSGRRTPSAPSLRQSRLITLKTRMERASHRNPQATADVGVEGRTPPGPSSCCPCPPRGGLCGEGGAVAGCSDPPPPPQNALPTLCVGALRETAGRRSSPRSATGLGADLTPAVLERVPVVHRTRDKGRLGL